MSPCFHRALLRPVYCWWTVVTPKRGEPASDFRLTASPSSHSDKLSFGLVNVFKPQPVEEQKTFRSPSNTLPRQHLYFCLKVSHPKVTNLRPPGWTLPAAWDPLAGNIQIFRVEQFWHPQKGGLRFRVWHRTRTLRWYLRAASLVLFLDWVCKMLERRNGNILTSFWAHFSHKFTCQGVCAGTDLITPRLWMSILDLWRGILWLQHERNSSIWGAKLS